MRAVPKRIRWPPIFYTKLIRSLYSVKYTQTRKIHHIEFEELNFLSK